MGWTAPIFYNSNDGFGFADINKTNENIDYIRNQAATFNGAKKFTDFVTISGVSSGVYPTLGVKSGTASMLFNDVYGLLFGTVLSSGSSWIQSQRVDTTATAYPIVLQPSGGNVEIGAGTAVFSPTANDFSKPVTMYGASGKSGQDPLDVTIRNTYSGSLWVPDQAWGRFAFYSEDDSGAGAGVQASMDVYSTDATATSMGLKFMAASTTALVEIMNLQFNEINLLTTVAIDSTSTSTMLKAYNNATTSSYPFVLSAGGVRDYSIQGNSGLDYLLTLENSGAGSYAFAIDGIVSFNKVAIAFDKPVNPTTTPTSGTWDISDSGAPIPRGMYNVRFDDGTGDVKIQQNGNTIITTTGGAFFSDGTNTKAIITGTGIATFWKF
jgi:hypothetical protein